MSYRLFPNSHIVIYQDFELELIENEVFKYPHLLNEIREEVFNIAARSRGWDDVEGIKALRRNFKIGPLYEANALVLISRESKLVGLAGSVNNWHIDDEDKTIVHLCSVGLLPEAQNYGFISVLLGLLWISSWQDEVLRRNYLRHQVYISGITQSPFILALLNSLFDIYPSPYRTPADSDMVQVAQRVAARFDGHIPFDTNTFILRNECNFFYKRIPYSSNRRLNEFCDQQLRYDQGDVFVVVGRVIPSKIALYLAQLAKRYPELFGVLQKGLNPSTTPGIGQQDNLVSLVEVRHA